MHHAVRFTGAQIRYILCLNRLSRGGYGVKNVELAEALGLSRPSVHQMLKVLSDLGVVRQETFGLAHLTDGGRALARKYAVCYALLEEKMADLCGQGGVSEAALCGLLADMSPQSTDRLYASQAPST